MREKSPFKNPKLRLACHGQVVCGGKRHYIGLTEKRQLVFSHHTKSELETMEQLRLMGNASTCVCHQALVQFRERRFDVNNLPAAMRDAVNILLAARSGTEAESRLSLPAWKMAWRRRVKLGAWRSDQRLLLPGSVMRNSPGRDETVRAVVAGLNKSGFGSFEAGDMGLRSTSAKKPGGAAVRQKGKNRPYVAMPGGHRMPSPDKVDGVFDLTDVAMAALFAHYYRLMDAAQTSFSHLNQLDNFNKLEGLITSEPAIMTLRACGSASGATASVDNRVILEIRGLTAVQAAHIFKHLNDSVYDKVKAMKEASDKLLGREGAVLTPSPRPVALVGHRGVT